MEPMTYPTKRQRKELARELKTFAFEQSPMFQHGQIQSAEVYQAFEFIEQVPEAVWLPGTLQFDQTKIKLGFRATRFAGEGRSSPPVYSYEVTTEGTQLIHPRQLVLSDDAWRELWRKYFDDDMGDDHEDENGAVLDAESVIIDETIKDDIIDSLIDAGVECELYQKSALSFASCEDMIESSYERGVSIESALFDTLGTHDYNDGGWEAHHTPDGELYIPPTYAPDELSIGDEIEVRNQFADLIRAYGTDKEAAENGLLPHDHKLREMRYVLECLRKRRIDLL